VADAPGAQIADEESRVAALAAENASLRDDNTSLRGELSRTQSALANLRARYHQLLEELHLLKRRLVVAKAERLDDVAEAQLAFDKLLAETEAIERVLDAADGADAHDAGGEDHDAKDERRRSRQPPAGRRKLDESKLPIVRVEVPDPELEGKAECIGVDESSRVAYERGGYRRLITVRFVYKQGVSDEQAKANGRTADATKPAFRIVTAPMPVQADAHVIYDALFKGIAPDGAQDKPGDCGPPPIEVGCFAHARRKYWEAAVCRHALGLEGVRLIDAIFAADRELGELAPAQRKMRRDQTVRPLVDKFFDWARAEHAKLEGRGLVATALGYSVRHEQALRRFLDDGRLRMDNNSAERELRAVAVGRKAWLFYGSDDHASAAGNILSLVASCKLHDLDPEAYLAEIIRIVPYWHRDRYLELAPRHWRTTRAD
jgi:hypothetical protein